MGAFHARLKVLETLKKWVVRCDCGKYEHRTKILRWLGTDATDLCRECRRRTRILFRWWRPGEKATRATVPVDVA
jgi:hypothetical protein